MGRVKYLLGSTALFVSGSALATETVTYAYDARGRLVKVERTGDVNDGAKVEYTLDKADNREKVKSTKPPAPAS